MKTHIHLIPFIFVTILLAVIVLSCEKPAPRIGQRQEGQSQEDEIVREGGNRFHSVSANDYYTSGMHYKAFISAHGSLFIVNITKDSIECYNHK